MLGNRFWDGQLPVKGLLESTVRVSGREGGRIEWREQLSHNVGLMETPEIPGMDSESVARITPNGHKKQAFWFPHQSVIAHRVSPRIRCIPSGHSCSVELHTIPSEVQASEPIATTIPGAEDDTSFVSRNLEGENSIHYLPCFVCVF